ncbi:MAG: FecR family protein [Alphaproteobacteria bacterium]|nr:MAG: FecR family protein [Alphaproteobacteria bacterium]
MTAPSDPRRHVEEEAARWFARLRNEPVGEESRRAFLAWRDASLAHRRAFHDIESVWADLEQLQPVSTGRPLRVEVRRRQRSGLNPRTLLVACLAIALLGLGIWQLSGEAPWLWETHETEVGEQRTLMLADGSTVYLNTASRLSVRLTKGRRMVRLARGEALFEVSHDASRPFTVRTPAGGVRVLGTRFDVRVDGNGRRMRVAVLEGRVAVHAPEDDHQKAAPAKGDDVTDLPTLTAGQAIEVSARRVTRIAHVDLAALTAWRDGELVFRQAPLARVVTELNRYLPRKIRIADDAAGALPVTAVFRLEDRDAIVEALTAALPVKALSLENGTTVLFLARPDEYPDSRAS